MRQHFLRQISKRQFGRKQPLVIFNFLKRCTMVGTVISLFYGWLISFQRRLNHICSTLVMIQKMSIMPLEIVKMKNFPENSVTIYLQMMRLRYVFHCEVWITFDSSYHNYLVINCLFCSKLVKFDFFVFSGWLFWSCSFLNISKLT